MNTKVKVQYVCQPLYYKDFHCIGTECNLSCCFDWKLIGWSKEEYEKIVNAQISEELRKRIESAFEPVSHEEFSKIFDYQVKFDKKRKCPMLTENGLCMIQKELGEEYLSNTCRSYPRQKYICGNYLICTCSSSCIHALKMICNSENSMALENNKGRNIVHAIKTEFSETDKINRPILKYHRELFEFFYGILSDKSHSIETSFVLAGMAAQKIDEFAKKRQAGRTPEIIKALKPQLGSPAQIEKLENANENLSLKGNFAAGLLKLLKGSDIYMNVFENGIPSEEKMERGTGQMERGFQGQTLCYAEYCS